jgi:uncharacterized membrane protein
VVRHALNPGCGAAGRAARQRVWGGYAVGMGGSSTRARQRQAGPSRSLSWPQLTALVLAIAGLLDSAYQAYTKLSGTGLAGCSAKTDACVLVQNSSQAYILGIPMAVFGLVFYLFMTGICTPPAWRSATPLVHWARLGGAIAGMLFVLYLLYAELIELRQVCPYCTSIHVITFLLFSVIVFQASSPGALRGLRQARPAG